MTQQVTPESFFDSLSISHKLDSFLDGFKLVEVHLFSYFSSLLYLYQGNAISGWGHQYTVTDGYPFSQNLNEALSRHWINGLLAENDNYYTMTARGADELNKFKKQELFTKREKYLDAACTTSILIPYSQTMRALVNDPSLKREQEIKNNSWLEQMSVYQKLEEISKAIGVNNGDLILPAVSWIYYLTEIDQ